MNLSNLRQSHPLLLAHMKEIGYSERYIHSVQIEINRILLHEKDNSWNSYQDIYQDYASSPHSERSLLGKATLIGIIAHFDLEGIYPGKHQWHTLWERCVYTQLVPEFKGLVDHYRNLKDTLQICENTVKKNISAISNFLYFLQKAGCNSLSGICEQHVLDFFSDDGYGPNKTASHKNCISRVLRACSGYSEYCLTADSFLPHIHNRRKNVQYITQGEISVLREFADKDMFPLRDKAILFLLLYTGLRACDIVHMTFDSVDWKSEKLHICQQKTAVPLELPLSPLVGNAIFDYLTEERPQSRDEHIFLSKSNPHPPMTSRGLRSAILRIMEKSGIRQMPDDQKGSHLFRHHAATSMLEKGVQMPVISKVLGHTAADSLNPYLYADFVHLKECSISIEKYPVSGEVFEL